MKPEPPRLSDEGKRRQCLRPVDPVARLCPSRGRENPGALIEPKCLAAHPAAGGHFADQQAVSSHAWSLNPAPWVKVKSFRTPSQGNPAQAKGVADHGH